MCYFLKLIKDCVKFEGNRRGSSWVIGPVDMEWPTSMSLTPKVFIFKHIVLVKANQITADFKNYALQSQQSQTVHISRYVFILNRLDRIKTLVLLNKHFNMFMGNIYFLECGLKAQPYFHWNRLYRLLMEVWNIVTIMSAWLTAQTGNESSLQVITIGLRCTTIP